jgi:hypothetical protein
MKPHFYDSTEFLQFRNLKEKQAGSSVNAKVGQAVATATSLSRPAATKNACFRVTWNLEI